MKVGNKINSFLNNLWCRHGDSFGKKIASKKRRQLDKKEIKENKN